MTYCAPTPNNHDCGQSLLEQGWTVISEFGTLNPSRFGGGEIGGSAQLSAAGWSWSDGMTMQSTSYFTNPALFQFFVSGTVNGYIQTLGPSGPGEYLFAWANLYTSSCNCWVQLLNGTDSSQALFSQRAQYSSQSTYPSGVQVCACVCHEAFTQPLPAPDLMIQYPIAREATQLLPRCSLLLAFARFRPVVSTDRRPGVRVHRCRSSHTVEVAPPLSVSKSLACAGQPISCSGERQ